MRRLLGWTAGVVGIAALARTLARRGVHEPEPVAAPAVRPSDDRADALRRKLDETRTPGAASVPGPDAGTPEERLETIDERRARVHAKAQEAIAAMQEPLE